MSKPPLVEVHNLNINTQQAGKAIKLVKNLSFKMGYEKLGIVGASGSGKTLTIRALLGLLNNSLNLNAKKLKFLDHDLLKASPAAWANLRGKHISMIMQEAKACLNPLMKIGIQLTECYQLHNKQDYKTAKISTLSLLHSLAIQDPEYVFNCYPSAVSGGMAQRIMIGMMMIGQPELLLADEPTSALDAKLRIEIIQLLNKFYHQHKMGIIFITHDLALAASFCDRILVMCEGELIESCDAKHLSDSLHPYTQALLAATPRLVYA